MRNWGETLTKLGIALGLGVLAGLVSALFAILLLVLAGFLIVWGQDPKRTEEFIGGLPGDDRLWKALAQLE